MALKFAPSAFKKLFDLLELSILRHAKICAVLFTLFIAVVALGIPGLSVDSSAYSLINQDSKQQARLMATKNRFGAPNTFVLVVAGSRELRRQEVVKALLSEFSKIPVLAGRTFARLDFEDSDGDRPLLGLTGAAYWDFREFGGLPPSTDANTNGDINFVVAAAADAGNMYTTIAEFIKTPT